MPREVRIVFLLRPIVRVRLLLLGDDRGVTTLLERLRIGVRTETMVVFSTYAP